MIPFVRELDFEYGRCDPVSPLIRRVIARNPGPFTYTGTGVYIVGRGEVAVIDPGPDLAEHFDALRAALADERVTHVLVTHHHLDHSPLAHPLARAFGAKVYGLPAPADHGEAASPDSRKAPTAGSGPTSPWPTATCFRALAGRWRPS